MPGSIRYFASTPDEFWRVTMSGAIASSSAAFLLLPSPSSSPWHRRSRVSSALRSYGAAGASLHWARRGFSRDGTSPCAAAASSPAAGGEEGAVKAAGQRSKFKIAENEDATSPRAMSSITEQNGAAGSKSEVDPSGPVSRAELGGNVQISQSASAASSYWKDVVVGVGEQVGANVDTGGNSKVVSSSDDSDNMGSAPLAGQNVMNVIVVASECAPFCKTGGLGDVVGALPKALARRGHRVMVWIHWAWLSPLSVLLVFRPAFKIPD